MRCGEGINLQKKKKSRDKVNRNRHGWNHGSCDEEDKRENGYKRKKR
jgi:hypothetical protein